MDIPYSVFYKEVLCDKEEGREEETERETCS